MMKVCRKRRDPKIRPLTHVNGYGIKFSDVEDQLDMSIAGRQIRS